MNDSTIFIPCFVVLPLAAAFVNSLLGSRINGISDLLGNLTPLILFGLSLLTIYLIPAGSSFVYTVGGWEAPAGIVLVVDGLTSFMLVMVNMVSLAIAVYARDYMERYTAKDLFYTLWLLMIAGLNGVIVAGDLFNLYVFLEIAAVASYALVAFGTERHELEAGFKYAVMGTLGSLFILLGIVLLYSVTSTLNMADMSLMLTNQRDHNIILMVSVLFLMGFGLKAALVPFHAWLPDAHPSAPAPISAMLSGVLIKTLGIYALSRIFYNVIGLTPILSSILLLLGALSMVIGGLLAIGQWDLKRLLAYSSISQVGYVVLGIGLGTPLGLLGGLLHLFNHSIFKALLFLNAGAVEYATGSRDLRSMGGLGHPMPVTGTTSFVASMSIAGIPPFSGFWSKLLIVMALVQAGHLLYALLAVLVSILTLAMLMKVMKHAFFGELSQRWQGVVEVPWLMQTSMMALALLCLLSGLLLIPAFREGFLQQATAIFTDGINYAGALRGDVQR
jgi:multicomponent Na+:H+ antiporter subunit D